MLRVLDAYPASARTEPGGQVVLVLELDNEGPAASGRFSVSLRDNGHEVAHAETEVDLDEGRNVLELAARVPGEDGRGYEALLEVAWAGGGAAAASAVLVASHWRLAPRYGFLSEFAPGDPGTDKVRELARFHITVVQFYDWMYRHYRFLPPQDVFSDAMGRCLSLQTVRERLNACQALGMAALAYGAVYGAEAEFVRDRPDWVLQDASGRQLSLIDLFYITDLRAGAPWREHILREFEAAVAQLGFDGIHMDQYGFPKRAYDASGEPVDLAACFPGLIDEAAARLADRLRGAAVLFNAVNNWPTGRVATTDQAAVYIEVWPPHDAYRDLVELIRRARDLSGKQVVLAAYLEPFREGGPAAEASALLATAVIASAGGHHLLLGEGHAALRDPYYPNHAELDQGFVPGMRRYYDHTAALYPYLYPHDLTDVTTSYALGINGEIALSGAPLSAWPEPGSVWLCIKQRAAQLVINLVNLTSAETSRWNAGQVPPQALSGLVLEVGSFAAIRRVTWSSPDETSPLRELVAMPGPGGGSTVRLPDLCVWATLVVDLA